MTASGTLRALRTTFCWAHLIREKTASAGTSLNDEREITDGQVTDVTVTDFIKAGAWVCLYPWSQHNHKCGMLYQHVMRRSPIAHDGLSPLGPYREGTSVASQGRAEQLLRGEDRAYPARDVRLVRVSSVGSVRITHVHKGT